MKQRGDRAAQKSEAPAKKRKIDVPSSKIITINGSPCYLTAPDLDGDGITGGVEKIKHKMNTMVGLSNESELKDTFSEMNRDDVDPQTKMSAIDMRARIDNNFEETGLVMLNTLVSLQLYPEDVRKLALSKMRISVSRKGEGRKEMRDVAIGSRDHNEKKGMGVMDRLKNFVTPQKDKPITQ